MRVQPKVLCGVVVSAGRMMKAVKVQTAKQIYNSFLKKVGISFCLRSMGFCTVVLEKHMWTMTRIDG